MALPPAKFEWAKKKPQGQFFFFETDCSPSTRAWRILVIAIYGQFVQTEGCSDSEAPKGKIKSQIADWSASERSPGCIIPVESSSHYNHLFPVDMKDVSDEMTFVIFWALHFEDEQLQGHSLADFLVVSSQKV